MYNLSKIQPLDFTFPLKYWGGKKKEKQMSFQTEYF